jgi:hypothetical protein
MDGPLSRVDHYVDGGRLAVVLWPASVEVRLPVEFHDRVVSRSNAGGRGNARQVAVGLREQGGISGRLAKISSNDDSRGTSGEPFTSCSS